MMKNLFRYCLVCAISANITRRIAVFLDLVYRIRSVQLNGCYNVRLEKQRYLKDFNDCPRWCFQIPRCLTVLAYFDYDKYHCVISYGNFLRTRGCPPGVFYWKKCKSTEIRNSVWIQIQNQCL